MILRYASKYVTKIRDFSLEFGAVCSAAEKVFKPVIHWCIVSLLLTTLADDGGGRG